MKASLSLSSVDPPKTKFDRSEVKSLYLDVCRNEMNEIVKDTLGFWCLVIIGKEVGYLHIFMLSSIIF